MGSLKLQVSFVEYSLFYRALLQKRPMILRSVLDHNADTHSHTQIDAYSHTHTHAKLPRCSLSRLDDDTALLHVCVCVCE